MSHPIHFDHCGTSRFITFSTHDRKQLLADPVACHLLATEIDKARKKHRFRLHAYVFMPEHVHLLITPLVGAPIGRIIGEIKCNQARKYFAQKTSNCEDHFWLPRCYDHNCRSAESARAKIRYCHLNPVRRGLVAQPEEWYWSSFRAVEERANSPLGIDAFSER